MNIKRCITLSLTLILIILLFFIGDYILTSNKLSKIQSKEISLCLKDKNTVVNTDSIKVKTMSNEDRDKYKDIEEIALNTELKEVNRNIGIVDLHSTEHDLKKRDSSIQVNYNEDIKPSRIQVVIQSKDEDLYYWEYELNNDKFLNFILPEQLLDQEGIYYVQVNILWEKFNKLLLTKQYNFNIEI
jgi:dTDP-4-amino-4,6-dideoxygalactose transaminase